MEYFKLAAVDRLVTLFRERATGSRTLCSPSDSPSSIFLTTLCFRFSFARVCYCPTLALDRTSYKYSVCLILRSVHGGLVCDSVPQASNVKPNIVLLADDSSSDAKVGFVTLLQILYKTVYR